MTKRIELETHQAEEKPTGNNKSPQWQQPTLHTMTSIPGCVQDIQPHISSYLEDVLRRVNDGSRKG